MWHVIGTTVVLSGESICKLWRLCRRASPHTSTACQRWRVVEPVISNFNQYNKFNLTQSTWFLHTSVRPLITTIAVPNMLKLRRYEIRVIKNGRTCAEFMKTSKATFWLVLWSTYAGRALRKFLRTTTEYVLRPGRSGIHVDFMTTTQPLRSGRSGNQVKYEPNFICFVSVDTTLFASNF